MNTDALPKLLHGPYQAPRLPVGSRTTCLLRDCDVIITSWTDAPISWPRCRALVSRGGGSGLLLDEELARAVRGESALAVMACWGVTAGVVWRWRRALAVTVASNAESLRLVQESSRKGVERMKTRTWSPEEREARRQRNQELHLAQHIQPGYHGPRWTAEELALLGTLPDEEVATLTGRSVNAVRLKRERLERERTAGKG